MNDSLHALLDFASLLLFPFLGVLSLLKRRALHYLVGAILIWLALGALAFLNHWHPGLDEARAWRAWLVGVALGAAFLVVAWLKDQRKVARWLKLTMALLTLAVFVRALLEFFRHYA